MDKLVTLAVLLIALVSRASAQPPLWYIDSTGVLVPSVSNISVTVSSVSVGAVDTTVTRAGAGDLSVEGNLLYRAGGTDVPVADGGTGASDAAGARMSLGAQAQDADLDDLADGSLTGSKIGTGIDADRITAGSITGTGSLVRAMAPQLDTIEIGHPSDTTLHRISAGDLRIEGNLIYRADGTDVPVADGGTGASDASGARTNLGLAIGTDVQAFDADLADLADGTLTGGKVGFGIDADRITAGSITGTGSLVRHTSPVFMTPNIGTPSNGALTNCTNLPVTTGISGLGSGVATMLATPTSANVAAAVTNETGSGMLVFATSPALVTPNIGTPSQGSLVNCTNLPVSTGISGMATGVAAALADMSSANIAAAVTDETGSGALVFGTSPTLMSPEIGDGFDTTLARVGDGGDLSVEGRLIYRADGTDVPVADGGTGASDASGARTNLGLVIGTHVQAFDADLADLADGTLTGSKVGTFGAAGGSHAIGAVPDPGATSHANVPRLLADTGAFVMHSGRVLGTAFVTADETTTSTTTGSLATPQSVSFTLDETTTVLCTLTFNCYQSLAGANCRFGLDVDGVNTAPTDITAVDNNAGMQGVYQHEATLTAGAHTVTAEYAAIGGGTAHFRSRALEVKVK